MHHLDFDSVYVKAKLSKKRQRFFEIARQVSLMSSFTFNSGRAVRIGCIIVSNKKHIIASGYNQRKTHPRQYVLNSKTKSNHINQNKKNCSFIHAEIDAITSKSVTDWHLYNKAEVYLYREDMNGNLACSRPCESCMTELKNIGISKIHYTDINGFFSEKI